MSAPAVALLVLKLCEVMVNVDGPVPERAEYGWRVNAPFARLMRIVPVAGAPGT